MFQRFSATSSDLMTTPLILLAGFSQSARHRVIREALSRSVSFPVSCPTSNQRPYPIAWLDHQDSLTTDQDEPQPNQSFVACVCCVGSIVFTTQLARVLRQGPWGGLFISLGARAEPARILSMLSTAPWNQHLGPIRLFSVMDATALGLCAQHDHAMHEIACQQRDEAEQVLSPGEFLPTGLFTPNRLEK
jgi:hypothetical protein